MPVRRHPVRRAAVTGAVGYAAFNKGKKSAQQQAPDQSAAAPPAAAATTTDEHHHLDVYLEIDKLGELRERGLLSDSEFAREKVRLLG